MSNYCFAPAFYKMELAMLQIVRSSHEYRRSVLVIQAAGLEAIIQAAQAIAQALAEQAAQVLQAKSGIERPRYSYHLGQNATAHHALSWLNPGAPPALIWVERPAKYTGTWSIPDV